MDGLRIAGSSRFPGPASSTRTETGLSSVKRAATVSPAVLQNTPIERYHLDNSVD